MILDAQEDCRTLPPTRAAIWSRRRAPLRGAVRDDDAAREAIAHGHEPIADCGLAVRGQWTGVDPVDPHPGPRSLHPRAGPIRPVLARRRSGGGWCGGSGLADVRALARGCGCCLVALESRGGLYGGDGLGMVSRSDEPARSVGLRPDLC